MKFSHLWNKQQIRIYWHMKRKKRVNFRNETLSPLEVSPHAWTLPVFLWHLPSKAQQAASSHQTQQPLSTVEQVRFQSWTIKLNFILLELLFNCLLLFCLWRLIIQSFWLIVYHVVCSCNCLFMCYCNFHYFWNLFQKWRRRWWDHLFWVLFFVFHAYLDG